MNDTLEDSRNGTKEDHDGKRKRSSSSEDEDDKKKRVKWAGHLHDQFLRAVQKLGEKAVPSAILNEMGVEGLTRENVASHLQKYRVQTREKLLSEYLKSNSGAGFGSMDDMRGPSEYSQPPPEAYLRRRSESELSYYHSHNYRNPVHPYPPYHLPPSAVHSSSNHAAPPPPPSHAPVHNEPPSRSSPYDHPPPFPNYHGGPPPHANNYSGYPNYGYGHSGNGRSASFSYNPREYHPGGNGGAGNGANGYNSIEPFADFDSPPSWRTGQQLVVSSQPPPPPPTQRSNSFSEPAPRRPSYNESMMQAQISQPPPQPPSQSTFAEPPARRPSFSGEGRRGSFSTEGRRGSFSGNPAMAQQQQPQQTHQPPPPQQQQQQPPPQQHQQHQQHSGISSLPSLPPPPSIRTSYDSVPTSVLTGGSSNYFDVNTPTSSEYSSDVLLSLSENHSSQMTPTTISFPPPSPSPEPSSAQSKDPFSDFPHIGDRGSHSDSYSSSYPAHAHTAPNAGYSNYHHHSCGNSWCTGCSKVEEQV